MRTAFFLGLACLALPSLRANDEPTAAIKPHSPYEIAVTEAVRENKPLLLVFTGKWEPASAKLEEDCLRVGKVARVLAASAVVARFDALATPELTAKYHVRDVPLMVLLKPDGTEIDRWLGAVSPSRFAEEFSRALAGHPTIENLRKEIKPSKPETRRDLANLLFNRGSYADALSELKRLYEQLEYGTTRDQLRNNKRERRKVIALLGEIHLAYPPAAELLRAKRTAHAADAAPPSNQAKYARRIADIDRALGQPGATLDYFRSLPKGGGSFLELRSVAFGQLVAQREYVEAAALYQPEELAKQIEQYASIPWAVIHGIVRTTFPFKAGEIIRLLHSTFTAKFARDFEAYAGVQNKDGARLIAQMTIKHDRSEQALPLLSRAARRALGEKADAFLRSLEIPRLPLPEKSAPGPDIPEPSDITIDEEDAADPVIKLSPFVVTARTVGVVPMEISLPSILSHKSIPKHLPIKAHRNIDDENLDPYRDGGWLVAINGKSIKGQDWKWLSDFWLEGGETGEPVTLILKGIGDDDCVYHEITVKRVRPAVRTEHN